MFRAYTNVIREVDECGIKDKLGQELIAVATQETIYKGDVCGNSIKEVGQTSISGVVCCSADRDQVVNGFDERFFQVA